MCSVCSCAVPAVLNETLPAAVADVERELSACQRLAWQYTALLEKIMEQDTDGPVQPHVLKHSLYNTRQHEAFLKIILVSSARHHLTSCSEELQ